MRYLIHDVFIETVEKFPNKVAVVEEEGKKWTYAELNHLANQFAHCIRSLKKEIRVSPFVGILSSVHAKSIAAVLGALKVGCAYVPLDEYSPTERLTYILESTKLDLLIIDPIWLSEHKDLILHSHLKNVLLLDFAQTEPFPKKIGFDTITQFSSEEPPKLNQVSDDLSYILHTSGSTGNPKGIMLTHRNARTFVDWMDKEFEICSEDIVMSRAPFKFDLSVFDLFNTFKRGATLVCYNWNRKRGEEEKHRDYVKLMQKEKATVLYTTPSTFITLINRGGLGQADLKLTRLMYAGEPFPIPQLKKLQAAVPGAKIANIYGPTETNIITYYWVPPLDDKCDSIPLGLTVVDTEIIVVSEDRQRICEPNEVGELWCRGGTVTIGYLGMPEKTSDHLVKSPFHAYPAYFWRTGDYGFLDSNGLLHYRGRKDHMVKVKGYRIEIGEIEAALSSFEGLDEFAVIAVPHADFGNELVCFYSKLAQSKFEWPSLKGHLEKKIPLYMAPTQWFEMEVMPKTSSGKVDRIQLASKVSS